MSVNLLRKRLNGGTSWADAVVRKQADSKAYSTVMFQRIVKRNSLECSGYKIQLLWKSFRVLKYNKCILKMSYKEVEDFREVGVFAFEQHLEKGILKYAFDSKRY